MAKYPTDEDLQIARLQVHRDLVGWVIHALNQSKILAERTRGNDSNGDIRLNNPTDIFAAKALLREIHQHLHGESVDVVPRSSSGIYIEIKAYSGTTITSGLVRQLIRQETVLGIVTTTKITQPAKLLLNQADIAWIDRFPEDQLRF